MLTLIAAPDMFATAAADAERSGSAIGAANSTTAAKAAEVLVAARDELSAATSLPFSNDTQQSQALSARAASFHVQCVQAPKGEGRSPAESGYLGSQVVGSVSDFGSGSPCGSRP